MRKLVPWLSGLLLLAAVGAASAADKHLVTYVAKQNFEAVKSGIQEAILEKGLVINNTSHIGEMLERTGKDLGGKQVFVQAESYEFCSAAVSRMTMEADPHNIVFCPYIISVYVLPKEPNKTYISFRKPEAPGASPASRNALQAVEKLLRSIVEQALENI